MTTLFNTKKVEWKIHSKTKGYKYRIDEAKKIIDRAINTGIRFGCYWSGGKDSTVMTHLVKSMYPDCPVLTIRTDADWDLAKTYCDKISKDFGWDYHVVSPNYSVFDDVLNNPEKNHSKKGMERFLSLIRQAQKLVDCYGNFVGLRTQESKGRKTNRKFHGVLYEKKGNGTICTPIVDLNVQDIFAYHIENNIEINPFYLQNKFRKPEEIRFGWMFPPEWGFSRDIDFAHMRYYYPEVYEKIIDYKRE